jgi:hypothetical protein
MLVERFAEDATLIGLTARGRQGDRGFAGDEPRESLFLLTVKTRRRSTRDSNSRSLSRRCHLIIAEEKELRCYGCSRMMAGIL